jgi:hypothetical protein
VQAVTNTPALRSWSYYRTAELSTASDECGRGVEAATIGEVSDTGSRDDGFVCGSKGECDFTHKLELFMKHILAVGFAQERFYRLLA